MFRLIQATLFITLFLFSGKWSFCFSQEANSSQEIEVAIEKAIKKVYKDKAQQEEVMVAGLEGKLKSAVREWISKIRGEKDPQMHQLISQSWELLSKFGPRIHYNYYLRGYDYLESEADIVKTDSILGPYKGYSKITEIIYAEKEHPAGASDISQFFYTVTTPIKVNFDYKKDSFIFVNAERGELSLKQGWPEEMVKRRTER
ncbi:MAG: hypothetical protein V1699_02805 [Candidatus Omnitrophota bacterium]